MKKEIAVASVIIAVAAWFFWQASFLPTRSVDPIGPSRYPQILAVAVIFFAVLHMVVSYFRRHRLAEEEEPDPLAGRARWIGNGRIVGVVFLTAAYAFLMGALGFTLSTLAYMVTLMLLLGVRSVPSLALSSLGIAISLVLLFAKFLGVLVPEGVVEELLLH